MLWEFSRSLSMQKRSKVLFKFSQRTNFFNWKNEQKSQKYINFVFVDFISPKKIGEKNLVWNVVFSSSYNCQKIAKKNKSRHFMKEKIFSKKSILCQSCQFVSSQQNFTKSAKFDQFLIWEDLRDLGIEISEEIKRF